MCMMPSATKRQISKVMLSDAFDSNQIKSNQITFIVTSPQHKCLGEWNSYERAPDSAKKQNNNLHMDSTYLQTYRRQCAKYTYIYSVHMVYYETYLVIDTHYTLYVHVYIVLCEGATNYKLTADWLSSR